MLCKLRCVNDHEFFEEELKMVSAAYFYGVRGGSSTYFAVCPYCGTDEYEEIYEEEEEEEEKDNERD